MGKGRRIGNERDKEIVRNRKGELRRAQERETGKGGRGRRKEKGAIRNRNWGREEELTYDTGIGRERNLPRGGKKE